MMVMGGQQRGCIAGYKYKWSILNVTYPHPYGFQVGKKNQFGEEEKNALAWKLPLKKEVLMGTKF